LPLATMTAQRVTNFYDLMDAAYDAEIIRAHSRSLGHEPIIAHCRRWGEKESWTRIRKCGFGSARQSSE
jgi:hypothetical protein